MQTKSDLTNAIHEKALQAVLNFKRCEVELIEVLAQVDQHKVYYALGYSSLFKYATDGLGLSPECAYIFINVSRKSIEVPALKEEIRLGTITVSKAKRITPVLNTNNQEYWLHLAKTASKRELEKYVAAANPQEWIRESLNYVGSDKEVGEKVRLKSLNFADGNLPLTRVQLQVGVSETLMLKLRRVQDLVSQKTRSSASLETAFEAMAELYLAKHDPVKKAERQKIRGKLQRAESSNPSDLEQGPGPVNNFRAPLPSRVKHEVYLKFGGQCTHQDELGRKCTARRHLEIHHIVEVAKGGQNELSNLTLLCSGHHRAHHFKKT